MPFRPQALTAMIALVLTLVTEGRAQPVSADTCEEALGGTNVTVLLVADIGTFTGTAEGFYYSQALQNTTTLDPGLTSCAIRTFGTIFGQPVALIATGIGEVKAAICTSEVLQCGDYINDIIFSGTAGFTPQVGGAVDPSDCTMPNTMGAPAKIGDLCITPFAVNWNCREGSFKEACAAFPNQCGAPGYDLGPDEAGLYGQCLFTTFNQADLTLSDELISAAQAPPAANELGVAYATPASYLTSYQSTYWTMQSNASGTNFTASPTLTTTMPNVFDYTVCAETDSQYFWTSLPWDYLGRSYIAMTINEALNMTSDASSVLGVSAEEGVGFLAALYKYAGMTNGRAIPHTMIRSASDYTYLPVDYDVRFLGENIILGGQQD
ncbi:hypothetical protein WJX84_004816 [Apatococcus fuscideae]|uniref:Uncharacterized protein n=1 Tax=Apatococcus fuscideae TaxID=2026836 RepID=A0AAW1TDV6_9CHLO